MGEIKHSWCVLIVDMGEVWDAFGTYRELGGGASQELSFNIIILIICNFLAEKSFYITLKQYIHWKIAYLKSLKRLKYMYSLLPIFLFQLGICVKNFKERQVVLTNSWILLSLRSIICSIVLWLTYSLGSSRHFICKLSCLHQQMNNLLRARTLCSHLPND